MSELPSVTADQLTPGQITHVTAIQGLDPAAAQRLHEMGFDEGVEVEMLHRAPLGGDPLALRVGGMVVALRRRFAQAVVVEPA